MNKNSKDMVKYDIGYKYMTHRYDLDDYSIGAHHNATMSSLLA